MASTFLYYNVLKTYKGTDETYKGNTHLLIVPITSKKYLYLAVIGRLIDEVNSYATHLIVSLPSRLIGSIISGEEEHFGDRYVVVEKLKCVPHMIGENKYNIVLSDPGESKNIKSDLTVEYHPEFNIGSKRVYVVTGELKFEAGEVASRGVMGMTAAKQSALMGKKERFEEPETKQEVKEQDMENTDKLILGLMGSVKESSLPKKAKLLLLDLVSENEDIEGTLEVLESFSIINEVDKEKIKAWAKKHKKGLGITAGAGLGLAGVAIHKKLKKNMYDKITYDTSVKKAMDDLFKGLPK
jgi:hypothetical protein